MMFKKNNIVLLLLFVLVNHSFAAVRNVPSAFSTITLAISASNSGDTISIAAGTYAESFTVNNSLTVLGAGTSTLINGSVTISANNVTCKNFKVQGSSTGISASTVSNLSLINITSYGNSDFGASLGNITTVNITGGVYSKNYNHGLSIANCTNLTMTNVVADSNGTIDNIQAGIQLYAVTGTSVLTNLTARKNSMHGLFIYYGSSGITVQGGTFSNNGVNQYYDGGGIALDAGTNKTISNIIINGPITAQNNETAGIWMTATANTDSIKNVVIGQTGLLTVSSNNSGGIIVYGNIYSTTITANFTKGTPSAAGILILGTNSLGTLSPQNTIINSSTFSGYSSGNPAITLSSGTGKKSSANASGSGNTFVGYSGDAAIENVVYHKPDDAVLGTVSLSNNNPVPVELVSFTARLMNRNALLEWSTATEVKNYGFEIERRTRTEVAWKKIGFIFGNGTSNIPHSYRYSDQATVSGMVNYRLKQIDADGSFSYSTIVSIEASTIPHSISGVGNYPNPFNNSTNITMTLPEDSFVEIILYDALGRDLGAIFSGFLTHGDNIVKYDAAHVVSGAYFYLVKANKGAKLGRLVYVK